MRLQQRPPAWMHGCMDAWMHGCMDAWMHGWVSGWCLWLWLLVCLRLYLCLCLSHHSHKGTPTARVERTWPSPTAAARSCWRTRRAGLLRGMEPWCTWGSEHNKARQQKIHSLTHSLTHTHTHSHSHLLTHTHTHSLTHSHSHLLTHSHTLTQSNQHNAKPAAASLGSSTS